MLSKPFEKPARVQLKLLHVRGGKETREAVERKPESEHRVKVGGWGDGPVRHLFFFSFSIILSSPEFEGS